MHVTRTRRAGVAAVALLPLLVTACGSNGDSGSDGTEENGTDDVAAMFDGKRIEIVVPYGPGGYDSTARLMAPYLEEALPGDSNIVITNVEGGGGLQGVQYAVNEGEPSLTLGMISVDRWIAPQLVGEEVEGFDMADIELLGTPAGGVPQFACVRNDRNASWEDLREQGETMTFGGFPAVGGTERQVQLLEMSDFPVEIVRGYESSEEIVASIARGETDATVRCAEPFTINQNPELIADPGLAPLWWILEPPTAEYLEEIGIDADPADIPELTEVVGDAASDQLLNAYQAAQQFADFARTMFIHSETPDAMAEAWREAWEEVATNEEYRAEMEQAQQFGVYTPADEIQSAIDTVEGLSPEGLDYFRRFIGAE